MAHAKHEHYCRRWRGGALRKPETACVGGGETTYGYEGLIAVRIGVRESLRSSALASTTSLHA